MKELYNIDMANLDIRFDRNSVNGVRFDRIETPVYQVDSFRFFELTFWMKKIRYERKNQYRKTNWIKVIKQ
jgi:hypothetical protein